LDRQGADPLKVNGFTRAPVRLSFNSKPLTGSDTVEPDQFSELLNQRPFRRLKNSSKIINAQGIERGDHREPSDDLRDQAERFEVFRLDLPQQSISRRLAIFRHLTESETAPPETLGNDVIQTDKRPAADKKDLARVKGHARLLRNCFKNRRDP